MNGWSFHNPVRIRFGTGSREALQPRLTGQRVLIVSTGRGRRQFEADALLSPALASAAAVSWVDDITQNPGLLETQKAIDALSDMDIDAVLAFGGGSAMDAAKALAAALARPRTERDLESLIADPARYLTSAVPIIALPTTAGTGSEVTPFATIWNHQARKKLSLASAHLFPEMAIVDPALTFDLPGESTFSTGLDALNQAFESVWNRNSSPMTRGFAGHAIGLALEGLPRLHKSLEDQEAREMLAQASLFAGLSISHTRTAICHAMSYPLTAHFGLAHGWACAVTMGAVAREVFEKKPEVFEAIAPLAGFAAGIDLLNALEAVLETLSVREVARKSIGDAGAIMALIPQMVTPGRSDNFILPVDESRLAQIVSASL